MAHIRLIAHLHHLPTEHDDTVSYFLLAARGLRGGLPGTERGGKDGNVFRALDRWTRASGRRYDVPRCVGPRDSSWKSLFDVFAAGRGGRFHHVRDGGLRVCT